MDMPPIPPSAAQPVFLYGRLLDPDLRRIVVGQVSAEQSAVLPDHGLHHAVDADGPVLGPSTDGAATRGAVFTLSPDQLTRLGRYARALDLQPRSVVVETAAGRSAALIYASCATPTADPWDFERWQQEAAPLARAAAADFMGSAALTEPEDLLPARLEQARGRAWSRHLADHPRPRSTTPPPEAPVEITDLSASHLGFFRLDAVTLRVPRFTGGLGPKIGREVFVGYDGALVLPYDPAQDTVLVVEQFRLGVWRRGDPDPWTLEPVAGMVDPSERPEDAARREAQEEAGLDLNWLEPIAGIYASPGYSADYFHCFVAGTRLGGVDGRIGGAISEAEDIRAHVLPLAKALHMVDTGEINVGPLVMMLLWLDRNKTRLRDRG